MNLKFKVAANTLFQLLGKSASVISTLITTIIIARVYGPKDYGNFTLVTTYVALFYLISDFGMNAVVLEKFNNQEEKNQYFKNLLGLRLIWAMLLVFLSPSILSLLPQNQGFDFAVRIGIIAYCITVVSQAVITTTNALFQNLLRYDLAAIATLIGAVTNVMLVSFVAGRGYSLTYIILSYTISSVLSSVVCLGLAKLKDKEVNLTPSFNFQKYKEIFTKSLPLGITLVFNLIYFRADTFIIAMTRTQEEVGSYGLSYRFFEFVLVFPTFFMNSLFPHMLKIRNDLDLLNKVVYKSSRALFVLSVVCSLVFIIISPYLIYLSAGKSFSESVNALRILSLSFPSFFLSALYMWVLITFGKRKLLALIYGASMVINVLMNLVLIPILGITGAAITTVVGETIILLSTYNLSKKFLKNV